MVSPVARRSALATLLWCLLLIQGLGGNDDHVDMARPPDRAGGHLPAVGLGQDHRFPQGDVGGVAIETAQSEDATLPRLPSAPPARDRSEEVDEGSETAVDEQRVHYLPQVQDAGMGVPAQLLEMWSQVNSAPPRDEIKRMIALTMGAVWVPVFECESRLNPFAVGDAGEIGLSQVHPVNFGLAEELGYARRDLFDPVINLKVAQAILARQGPEAWSCY